MARVASLLGFMLMVIGLGGLEDDIRGWIEKVSWLDGHYRWIFVVIGAALLVWANIPASWRSDVFAWLRPSKSVANTTEPDDAVVGAVPTKEFIPYAHLSSTLVHLDFTGLFGKTERYIDATLHLQRSNDDAITITGVSGRMNIGGEDCSLAPRLLNGPRVMRTPQDRWDCVVRQPLMPEMAQQLIMGLTKMNLYSFDGEVQVQLDGMTWEGVLHSASGERPLPRRVVSQETIRVRGPIREDTADKVTWRVAPQFVSQTYYHTHDGSLREPLERPAEVNPQPPAWFEKVIQQDTDDLRGAIALIDEQPQNYHVLFDLDHATEPGIYFRYMLMNTSVYTLEIPSVDGILQIDFKVYPGAFKIDEVQLPVILARRTRRNLFLKFVLNTEQAQREVKNLIAKCRETNDEICFELNNLKLAVRAREDPSATAELRFSQQYWRPSHESPSYNAGHD